MNRRVFSLGTVFSAFSLLGPALFSIGLTGCSANYSMPSVDVTTETAMGSIQGSVYGGQQPIWQAHVYMMAASTSGYGTTSRSMLKAAANTTADTTVLGTPANPAYYLTTDGGGNFNMTGDYTCTYNATTPAKSDQIYMLSLGGNDTYTPGSGSSTPTGGTLNPYIGLMSVLGQCPASGTFAGVVTFDYMNEVSTIATAYALAGFAGNSHSIGSSGTDLASTGLANAFANANQLYNINNYVGLHEARTTTPAGNGVVPYQLINTLANVLAACVNSTNTASVPTSGACQTLYNDTGNAADTATAAIYIAQHPGSNVGPLFNLQQQYVQFSDDLTSAPTDFSVGIKYTGAGLSSPVDVAVDAGGNAWVTSSAGYLSKLTPLGTHNTGSPQALGSAANYVAIDQTGNALVTTAANTVLQLGSTIASGVQTIFNGLLGGSDTFASPAGVASDGNGNTYVANPNGDPTTFLGLPSLYVNGEGDMVRISSTANPAYGVFADSFLNTGVLFNAIPGVSQVAADSSGDVWLSGDGNGCFILLCFGSNVVLTAGNNLNNSGNLFAPGLIFSSQEPGGCFLGLCIIAFLDTNLANPEGVAIDSGGNGWVAFNSGTPSLVKITRSNAATVYTGGGMNAPFGVTIDGASNIFVGNTGNNTVSKFSNAGAVLSPSGFAGGGQSGSSNLAVDLSGDVWVVNPTGNSVTELIGLGTPVVTPLSAAVASGKLGQRP